MDFIMYFIVLCYAELILFAIQKFQNDPLNMALNIRIDRYPWKAQLYETQIKILDAESATCQEWSDWCSKVYEPMFEKYPKEAIAFMKDYVGLWPEDMI